MLRSRTDVAIEASRELEGLLTKHFDAEGKGLHEKVSSVQHKLDPALVKRLRWIATMRNKTVHEDGKAIKDLGEFKKTAEQARNDVLRAAGQSDWGPMMPWLLGGAMAGVALIFLLR